MATRKRNQRDQRVSCLVPPPVPLFLHSPCCCTSPRRAACPPLPLPPRPQSVGLCPHTHFFSDWRVAAFRRRAPRGLTQLDSHTWVKTWVWMLGLITTPAPPRSALILDRHSQLPHQLPSRPPRVRLLWRRPPSPPPLLACRSTRCVVPLPSLPPRPPASPARMSPRLGLRLACGPAPCPLFPCLAHTHPIVITTYLVAACARARPSSAPSWPNHAQSGPCCVLPAEVCVCLCGCRPRVLTSHMQWLQSPPRPRPSRPWCMSRPPPHRVVLGVGCAVCLCGHTRVCARVCVSVTLCACAWSRNACPRCLCACVCVCACASVRM